MTEPYSTGIGGGGYFVYYDAKSKKVSTLDGRETAPDAIPHDAFIDPATGKPYPFTPQLVTSGVSVGVPGTLATWDQALKRWGRLDLKQALKPAEKIARRGFVVDDTFRNQTLDNKARFSQISTTADLYLPGGDAPKVGSIFRNPDLAATYTALGGKAPASSTTAGSGPTSSVRSSGRRPSPSRTCRCRGLHVEVRPVQVPGDQAQADQGSLPQPGRLRHGAVVQRWFDGG